MSFELDILLLACPTTSLTRIHTRFARPQAVWLWSRSSVSRLPTLPPERARSTACSFTWTRRGLTTSAATAFRCPFPSSTRQVE